MEWTLAVFDSSYSRYADVPTDAVRRERAAAGVSGAYGVFGSMAEVRRQTMLIVRGP